MMVLLGTRTKNISASIKEAQVRAAAKMVPVPSSSNASASPHKQKLIPPDSPGESDSELSFTQGSSQDSPAPSALLGQFEKMLHKALRQTVEHITNSLTKEIRELGNRTEVLELRVDEMENSAQDYMAELENLKEENVILPSRLEDYENRARRPNLHIRGSS